MSTRCHSDPPPTGDIPPGHDQWLTDGGRDVPDRDDAPPADSMPTGATAN